MEGYLIENGKITKPVRGATLIGTGAKVLENIDMVGNNQTCGQGMCGSLSGSIPTNVGQPTIRVKALTVGGRKGRNNMKLAEKIFESGKDKFEDMECYIEKTKTIEMSVLMENWINTIFLIQKACLLEELTTKIWDIPIQKR